MATLAAAISTDAQILEASKSLKELTNKRSSTASVNTTFLDKACAHAAATVARHLGLSLTSASAGDDTEAVDIGVRLVLERIRGVYGGEVTPERLESRRDIMAELEQMRAQRVEENDDHLVWHAPDTTGADRRYPAARRGRGYEQSTEESGG